jgi:NAD(P)-dependent dehydrogenase (short-subunit alcohol dehydrogenase family)
MSAQERCRVLVLGGYGHFGARIVRSLAITPGITVIAAGRNPAQAAARLPGVDLANIELCRLDTAAADFAATLAGTRADLVIHTAGPFQGQGYDVAQACLRAGMHYIDLADGREFVAGFPGQLDALAQRMQCCAITGASTLPALSSAVVDALAPQFEQLHSIDMVIAPAQATPLGIATVRAVLSYCGRPFDCWIDGCWQTRIGWAKPQPVRFARIGPRLASPCDVPDHTLLVQRYPGVATVRFRAALELPLLSRCLAALASRPAVADGSAGRGVRARRTLVRPFRHGPWRYAHHPARPTRWFAAHRPLGPDRADAARPGDSHLRRGAAGAPLRPRGRAADWRPCLYGHAEPGRVRARVRALADRQRRQLKHSARQGSGCRPGY